jgi:SAM-dependent methyltransferase
MPWCYRAFAAIAGGSARSTYQREYLRVKPGERVLDIGCGPADVLEVLPPECEYVGFDESDRYIEAARQRYRERGRFEVRRVSLDAAAALGRFDIAMANGVLHHLDDAGAHELLVIARAALGPGGRLVTLDGCYATGQSRIARYMLSRDRGRYVRTRPEYEALARAHFSDVRAHVRHDLMRVPYTHIIMECRP